MAGEDGDEHPLADAPRQAQEPGSPPVPAIGGAVRGVVQVLVQEVAEGRIGTDQLPRAREHQQAPGRMASEMAMLSVVIDNVPPLPVVAWHVFT